MTEYLRGLYSLYKQFGFMDTFICMMTSLFFMVAMLISGKEKNYASKR